MDSLLSSLLHSLESHPSACDVDIKTLPPVTESDLSGWEYQHCVFLPSDLKEYYLTQNGLQLTWNIKAGQSTYRVGRLSICELSRMKLAPQLDLNLQFKAPVKIVVIDENHSIGQICLLYQHKSIAADSEEFPWGEASIWILRRGCRLEFLADSFMNYFRLMVAYAGLEEWPNRVLGLPLSPVAKQWYYIMGRLCLVED